MKTKALFLSLLLAMLSSVAFAQSGYVTVTATVPSYAGGQATGSFQNQSSASQLPLLNGSVFATTAVANMDFTGKFTMTLADNLVIQPTPSQWQIIICAKAGNQGQPCFPVTLTITCVGNPSCSNGTLDISSAFSGAPPPPLPPGSLPFAQFPGQILTSLAAGSSYAVQGRIFYSQVGDTVSSIEAECSSLCTYVVTTPQTITLTADHVLDPRVQLSFAGGGKWTVNGPFTLTIPSPVLGSVSPHFAGTAALRLVNPLIPVEWFGAVGDWNGTIGTDNTTAIQACLNSLTAGQCVLQALSYKTTAPLTINKSSVGITGTSTNFAFAPVFTSTPPGSVIISTSATADVIDVAGSGLTSTIAFNRFEKFTIARSVIPTGTSAGISLNYTFGVVVENVTVEDSVRAFYIHASGASGGGRIDNSTVVWGANGVTETSGSFYGFYLDSADGNANPSLRIRHVNVSSTLGAGVTTYGLIATGTAINDLMVYGFETASTSYGEYVQQTGVGANIASSDIHFYGSINDGCKISCYFVNGITAAGGAGVEISGGYNTPAAGTSPLIDIQNATNVRVSGVQLGIAQNALGSAAINVVNSSDVTITGNQIQGIRNVGVLLTNSTAVAVTGNDLNGNLSANGLINLVNSSFNSITGNVLSGTGNSLQVDATSNNNAGLYANAIATSLNAAVVLGTNPLTNGAGAVTGKFFSQLSGPTWTPGAGAPTGSCLNGSMYSNTATTVGTFATYQCKSAAWVGIGTAY